MNLNEKIQRNSNDIVIIPSEEELLFRKKFKDASTDKKCTICNNKTTNPHPHPALRVIVCSDCLKIYDNAVFLSNKDGTDKNCRWCSKSATKFMCSSCTVVFCQECLGRNFNEEYVEEVAKNSDWKCLICNHKKLWALRAECAFVIDIMYKDLDPEMMAEARLIFTPSKKNFERLMKKIVDNCQIFSRISSNQQFKNAQNVFELTEKVSLMCKCIQDVIKWIDDCNKDAYNEWFDKFKESDKAKESDILQNINKTDEIKTEINNVSNSGVSDNFFNFLNNEKNDLTLNKIKTEDEKSVFSEKTVVLVASKSSNNGVIELENRILSDFNETVDRKVETKEFLCEKTGDIFEGFEVCSSRENSPIIFDESRDLSEFEFKVNDFCDNEADLKVDEMEELKYSPELMKLLNNDFSEINGEVKTEVEGKTNEVEGKTNEVEEKTTEVEGKTNGVEEKTAEVEEKTNEDEKNEETSLDKINEEKTNEIEAKTNEETSDDESSDEDLKKALNIDKDVAFQELIDSSESYSSTSSLSSSSDEEEPIKKDEENLGYIKTLDIANELHKLRKSLPQETKELDKFDQKCEVKLQPLDLSKYKKIPDTLFGYSLVENSSKSSKSSSSADSDSDINKLLNLKNLENKKRSNSNSSASDSSSKSKSKKLKKKKKFSSKSDCDTVSSDSDSTISGLSLLSQYKPPILPKDKSIWDDFGTDSDVSFHQISSDSSQEDADKESTSKIKTRNVKKADPVPDWKKDKLLTGKLDCTETTKNKTKGVDDKLLEEEEEKFWGKISDTSPNKLFKNGEKTEDAIILSDTSSSSGSESSDSDIQIISSKRKKIDDDDEEEGTPHKKGRRNIKKVLDDSELQEETQIADLEEEQRKERLSMKKRSLDAVLSQSSLSQEDLGLVLDLDETKKIPLVKIPQVLVNPLKPHQINGIKFMWDVCFESIEQIKKTRGAGCILAHCMGLGKTMQVVVLAYTLLTHKQTQVRHVLIICPLSTVFNWRNEFEQTLKNAPEKIKLFDIRSDRHKSFKDRIFQVKLWRQQGGVLMMGYDSFTTLVNEKKLKERVTQKYCDITLKSLIDPGPDLIVCDEGHILKNSQTYNFKSINRCQTRRRIILTGTPLQNNLKEYWHMVSFVKPHLLGTFKEYSNRFVNPIVNGQYEDSSPLDIQLMKKRSHVLHKKLRTTVNRYELSELKQYLPNKHEYVLFIQLSPLQIKLYELYLERIRSFGNLFQHFHHLQNIWTHPQLLHIKYEKKKTYDEDFDPDLDPDSVNSQNLLGDDHWFKNHIPSDLTSLSHGSKMLILFSIIRESCALNDKLLVFSSSIPELDLIEDFLKQNAVNNNQSWTKNYDYYRMDGSVLPEQRMRYCNSFNDEKNTRARLFLISHKVGGLGLNLIAANRVVLMDVNWNPAYDTQSVFRVYRFGQKKQCFIYRLVSLGTMEELVYSRAVTKLAISCRVVDEQQIRRHFKEDDQHKLYKLNTDYLHQEPVTPNVPTDRLLANLWGEHKPILYNFKDHQSMLENLADEELNEEEMKLAWEEFKNEEINEKNRLTQLAANKEFYKTMQQFQMQHIMPQNLMPSTSTFIPPGVPPQIFRYKPVDTSLPNPRSLFATSTPNPRQVFPDSRPSVSPILSNRVVGTNVTQPPAPRPVGMISNNVQNPFNPSFKNVQSTETIIPDLIQNHQSSRRTNKLNRLVTKLDQEQGKKMPQLVPVPGRKNPKETATNGRPPPHDFWAPSDEIINLE